MMIYDKDYDDNDYHKMMEETGKMINQLEALKKKVENEYEEILKIRLIPEDGSTITVQEYEEMLVERNSMITGTLNNLNKVNANISYLKNIGCELLIKTGVLSKADYNKSKIVDFVLEKMEDLTRELVQAETIIDEYNELKLTREVDMLIVTEDSNINKDYKAFELEEKYNEDSAELDYIDKQLFELEMIKLKIVEDLDTITYFLTPKENEKTKTKKKTKGE